MLPDVLKPGLAVVFCGTAAGEKSARVGAYYAGPGNKFWRILHETGLTPQRLEPAEFATLPEFGIGLTDLAKTASGSDRAIGSAHFDAPGLQEKIARFGPAIVAFNGKHAAEKFIGRPVHYGRQEFTVANADAYVLPSTSGAANGFWDVSFWHDLAVAVKDARRQRAR
jgi:double-stranded uracil-DNA glycosylase